MVRRNMVQGQRSNNKASSTTVAQGASSNFSTSISNTKSTRSQSNDTSTAATSAAAHSPTSRKEASGTIFGTTAAADEATNIPSNSSSRTKGHTSNSRLLDQGRTILEESSCTTTDST